MMTNTVLWFLQWYFDCDFSQSTFQGGSTIYKLPSSHRKKNRFNNNLSTYDVFNHEVWREREREIISQKYYRNAIDSVNNTRIKAKSIIAFHNNEVHFYRNSQK
jgi:hypothetical protein